mmetsp:Transcript_1390/g.2446  ORF Transcript_1390/g.2446 Transcript_1390/m.2446 type:complete len:85 (+) Transcript_1390:1089-1343(+)
MKDRESLLAQKENGQVKAQGFYLFYHIFKFIGGLALLLAVLCVAILIFLLVQLIKGPSDVEDRRNLIHEDGLQNNSARSLPAGS